MEKPLIGFIGQGFIGNAYSNNFESRGYKVVRYDITERYRANKEAIKGCDIVFVAVPTPTTPQGFDASILEDATSATGDQVVVIKSTVLPSLPRRLQEKHPGKIILHSPEFLTAANAQPDTDNPKRNIVGYVAGFDDTKAQAAAKLIMSILPKAPYELITTAEAAAIIKYGGNVFLYGKVMLMNTLHDIASAHGVSWNEVAEALAADPRIGASHLAVSHQGGRGAGGPCFPKDFAAFRELYRKTCGTLPHGPNGAAYLEGMEKFNCDLLEKTGKSPDIIKEIYG
jgi:nucleotide sugar dehydrogenase